jgi:hypothetical protein
MQLFQLSRLGGLVVDYEGLYDLVDLAGEGAVDLVEGQMC